MTGSSVDRLLFVVIVVYYANHGKRLRTAYQVEARADEFEECARERRKRMGQDKYATQPNIDWDAIDARIDARLELERKCIREVVVDAFGEVAAKKEKVAKDQIEALRTQFEKLDSLFFCFSRKLSRCQGALRCMWCTSS